MASRSEARTVRLATLALAMAAVAATPGASRADWSSFESYLQIDKASRSASDFDITLKGDVRNQIGSTVGGSLSNGFTNGSGSSSLSNGDTVFRYIGDPIPPSVNEEDEFVIYGSGDKPKILSKAWTFPKGAPDALPVTDVSYLYDPTHQTVTVIASNNSTDTVTLSQAGYLVTNTALPNDKSTIAMFPASSFLALTSLDHQYLPGQSDMAVVTGVSPSQFVMVYGSSIFSGSSSGNDYTASGIDIVSEDVASMVPEPDSSALVAGGAAALGLAALRRGRGRPRRAPVGVTP